VGFNNLEELEAYRGKILSWLNKEKRKVRICMTGCRAHGAQQIRDKLIEEIENAGLTKEVRVVSTGCQGFCARAPVMVIDPEGIFYQQVSVGDVREIVSQTLSKGRIIERLLYQHPRSGERIVRANEVPFYGQQTRRILRSCGVIDPTRIDEYIARDGYQALGRILSRRMSPAEVISLVKRAGLRGRGGAGFPTGLKWQFTQNSPGQPKFIICNADEGDPGAFMDRALLEGDPHSVLEGMIIAGYAIGAGEGYVYVRAEYPMAVEHLTIALKEAEEKGFLGNSILGSDFSFQIYIKQGAGAFVCGEETALIASIEGRRGMPRSRPPFPAQSGLWNRPTCINNVETLTNVTYIFLQGVEHYTEVGTEKSKGTKIFALAGKVENTGLVEVPIGSTLRKVVFDIGGGVSRGRKFKAVQIGGPSGGCIPERHIDTPIDYDSLKKLGAIMGSGGMVVMDDNTCMVDIARFFLDFVQDESCGKCVPCRLGTKRMLEILTRITRGEGKKEDLKLLEELARVVKDSSLCGLGQTAPNPVLSTLRYFSEEYLSHIEDRFCPACSCESLFTSPCQNVCPLGIDVPGYVGLIAARKYEEAYKLIFQRNPFPGISGRVCYHMCESKCRRSELDEPVAINALKRFVSDWAYRNNLASFGPPSAQNKKKIAVIGSGPAGLSAAHYLAGWGYQVTIFEALEVAGGMLAVGIPDYRLPKDLVAREIKLAVEDMGVEIKKGVEIGKDLAFDDLSDMGYEAIFMATGAHQSRKLHIPGENLKGVLSAVGFLREVNLGRPPVVKGEVTVIGGGNAAIDSARTALRLGAEKVRILYRRSREEMPALKSEIRAAEEEEIEIFYLAAPIRIIGENGQVRAVECLKIRLGDYDESGRRKPVPLKNSAFFLSSNLVILGIGQLGNLSYLSSSIAVTTWGTVVVEKNTLTTSQVGVFAGGDLVTGPATVVEAIASGERAALAIDKYLRGRVLRVSFPIRKRVFDSFRLEEVEAAQNRRIRLPAREASQRKKDFSEVELGIGEEAACEEAKRCLRCDLEQARSREDTGAEG